MKKDYGLTDYQRKKEEKNFPREKININNAVETDDGVIYSRQEIEEIINLKEPCFVNGYKRSDGTYVRGHFRKLKEDKNDGKN